MQEKQIRLVLGAMSFGERLFGANIDETLREYLSFDGYREIDTAYVYNGGASERALGDAAELLRASNVRVATKVNPRVTGKLDGASVRLQVSESLNRLKRDSVDVLYLHFPDPATPLESTLATCAELYREGKYRELGLSNFPAYLVADAFYRCRNLGIPAPTVYEGLYNPLSRRVESELARALREYGLRFYAYNPLAGGVLTDKYVDVDDVPTEGRFVNRPNYKARYWKPSYFAAVKELRASCEKYGISVAEASYRWLAWHSFLDSSRGDAIIVGVSSVAQLRANMRAVACGSLPSSVVDTFESVWELTQADAPEYFRFFNSENKG